MNILVINAGSSSCKYQLINMNTKEVLCNGLVERIGQSMSNLVHKIAPDTDKEDKISIDKAFKDHVEAMQEVVALLTDTEKGVIASKSEVAAIGHRVVMGGEAIKESVLVTDEVKKIIDEYSSLAPLHNPPNLAGIIVAESLFAGVPNVAVFDTEFHQTMPKEAYMFPLPYELYEEHRIRRYGFHGTSHRYVSRKAAEFLGKKPEELNLITCHLGNGCSISAIKKGLCVDTSMGTTPLDGVMMGTRCGAIDPALVPLLADKLGKSADEIGDLMNKESGFLGICGMNDLRDIHAARKEGNEKATLAFDMFVYRIKKYIGAYVAALGSLDGLIFTAGIGENDPFSREDICKDMEFFGIDIDLKENAKRLPGVRSLSKKDSVPVLIVPTNEELEIAEATLRVLGKKK